MYKKIIYGTILETILIYMNKKFYNEEDIINILVYCANPVEFEKNRREISFYPCRVVVDPETKKTTSSFRNVQNLINIKKGTAIYGWKVIQEKDGNTYLKEHVVYMPIENGPDEKNYYCVTPVVENDYTMDLGMTYVDKNGDTKKLDIIRFIREPFNKRPSANRRKIHINGSVKQYSNELINAIIQIFLKKIESVFSELIIKNENELKLIGIKIKNNEYILDVKSNGIITINGIPLNENFNKLKSCVLAIVYYSNYEKIVKNFKEPNGVQKSERYYLEMIATTAMNNLSLMHTNKHALLWFDNHIELMHIENVSWCNFSFTHKPY